MRHHSAHFTEQLFTIMKQIEPALNELDLYEFEYGLGNMAPPAGWDSVLPESRSDVECRVESRAFYDTIQIKPRSAEHIILDKPIVHLTNMLFVGLVERLYDVAWVREHFYFDVRSFLFLHRTRYFSAAIVSHLGGHPFRQFEQKQRSFECVHEVGYKAFREANAEVDACFIESVMRLIEARGVPIIIAIAGPTAAGKTEIVARLHTAFQRAGKKIASIEMDNFLTDREYREQKGIFTQGKQALHFGLFQQCLRDISRGKAISTPRYDFVYATSSHDLDGKLKPDGVPVQIEPADIVFIEGNFPFLIPEVIELIGLKVVYLTDDPVRLKRKWRRDIDYRKKYEPTYFRNRYFKDQFIMAEIAYRPQMEVCDLLVDTTGAALWATPAIAAVLDTP
ncbi:MAG: uridine kinase family protein [Anaerolineae bacterium]